MSARTGSVLIVGGSGVVGSEAARALRRLHPGLPIAIGGRDMEKAGQIAASIGNASPIVVDAARTDLGLGDGLGYSAVAVFLKDENLNTLRFAQDRGLPHVGISSGLFEITPDVSAFIHRPAACPILLANHWLAGAAVLTTLDLARSFGRIDVIRVGVVLDEQDGGGPVAVADFERLSAISSAGLMRSEGRFTWLSGDAARSRVRSVDGTELEAQSIAVPDVASLAMATDAPSIRFDMAIRAPAAGRRGETLSTEVLIEVEGETADGRPQELGRSLVHPEGMRPLTALAVAIGLERMLGIDGSAPVGPGLYLPETLIDARYFVRRAVEFGARLDRY